MDYALSQIEPRLYGLKNTTSIDSRFMHRFTDWIPRTKYNSLITPCMCYEVKFVNEDASIPSDPAWRSFVLCIIVKVKEQLAALVSIFRIPYMQVCRCFISNHSHRDHPSDKPLPLWFGSFAGKRGTNAQYVLFHVFSIPIHGDLPLDFTLQFRPDTASRNIDQWEADNKDIVFSFVVKDPFTNPWFKVWLEGVLSLP